MAKHRYVKLVNAISMIREIGSPSTLPEPHDHNCWAVTKTLEGYETKRMERETRKTNRSNLVPRKKDMPRTRRIGLMIVGSWCAPSEVILLLYKVKTPCRGQESHKATIVYVCFRHNEAHRSRVCR